MQILLNGENHPLDNGTVVAALLKQLRLDAKRLAVEIN